MQQGYIYFLNEKYDAAEIEYNKSLSLLKRVSPCNQPVILVKQMQLYGKLEKFSAVNEIYIRSMKLADSCKILKYKIYATEEIKSIYQKNNNKDLAFLYNNKLETLKLLENKDKNISSMHLESEEFLAEKNDENTSNFYKLLLFATVSLLMLLGIGVYFYRKSSRYKTQKDRIEEDNIAMKEVLEKYSEQQYPHKISEDNILNSQLLNERQRSLLLLISEGFTNREIAEKLFISENTVKYHIKNIYELLDLKNRKDLFRKLNN